MLNLIKFYRRRYKGTPVMVTVNKLHKTYLEMVMIQIDILEEHYLKRAEQELLNKTVGAYQFIDGKTIFLNNEECSLKTLFELELIQDAILENGYNIYEIQTKPL